jgi:hypothetical protein
MAMKFRDQQGAAILLANRTNISFKIDLGFIKKCFKIL